MSPSSGSPWNRKGGSERRPDLYAADSITNDIMNAVDRTWSPGIRMWKNNRIGLRGVSRHNGPRSVADHTTSALVALFPRIGEPQRRIVNPTDTVLAFQRRCVATNRRIVPEPDICIVIMYPHPGKTGFVIGRVE